MIITKNVISINVQIKWVVTDVQILFFTMLFRKKTFLVAFQIYL